MIEQSFRKAQEEAQASFFAKHHPNATGFAGKAYRLMPAEASFNLAPSIRQIAPAYFARHHISWHTHAAAHGLSSQACCLNFLMPLGERPDLLSRLVSYALAIDPPEMLRIEEPEGSFIGFEWVGQESYMNERSHNRGANATSVDAILRFRSGGKTEALLIEWKYTEAYSGVGTTADGNASRERSYEDICFTPNGPLNAEPGFAVTDFFYEPLYQLMRQQMLAFRMQVAKEDGAERVRVLHIAPAANKALLKVTAPKLRDRGDTVFAAFKTALVNPDDFVSVATEKVFAPLLAAPEAADWASYLKDRYTFVAGPAVA